jgi:predicted component of type VI protein secretion system
MSESEGILVVERGPVPATQFPLQGEQVTIGRSAGNDLVLADPEVSRRHMRVVRRVEGFAVEDTGSTNGTFVNGQRITHLTMLQDGDTIDLGDTVRLRFLSMDAEVQPDTSEKPTQAMSSLYHYEVPAYAKDADQVRKVWAPAPSTAAQEAQDWIVPPAYPTERPRRGRGVLVGCGLFIAFILVCAGTFLILDAYDQGRLLYCGQLASVFEVVLGPFGFAPICS